MSPSISIFPFYEPYFTDSTEGVKPSVFNGRTSKGEVKAKQKLNITSLFLQSNDLKREGQPRQNGRTPKAGLPCLLSGERISQRLC
jgi:hypothetical protein